MSREKFDDECPGCRPVLVGPDTLKPLPDSHPAMVAIHRVWETTTRVEREAFHRATCNNSRDPQDLMLVHGITQRFQQAMAN